jgi:hypothetical protein
MRPTLAAGIVSFLALPLAAGFLLVSVRTARADTNCIITSDDLAAITAAQAEGLLPELNARKVLLVRTITCAKADAQSLQNDLNGLATSGDTKTIQSQLSDKLNGAANYYDIELTKVDGAGISGTQSIAREVLDWRAANYEPLANQVANLTLWLQNQALFNTAKDRLNQMKSLVSFIGQVAPNADLQSSIGNAEATFQAASDENQAAKDALLRSLPPDATLALLKGSLQSLSDMYQKFFDISSVMQKLLSVTEK